MFLSHLIIFPRTVAEYETNQEGGVFYPGDEEKSYISYGLFVNAWQPLPRPYKEDN